MSRAANHLLALASSLSVSSISSSTDLYLVPQDKKLPGEVSAFDTGVTKNLELSSGLARNSCTDAQRNPACLFVFTPTQVLEDFVVLCLVTAVMDGK